MRLLLIFIFFSFSVFAGDFEEKILHRWKGILNVQKNSKINESVPIEEPAGISVMVMEVILNAKNFRPIKDCVLYVIPKSGETGTLYIHQAKITDSCESFHLNFETLKKENIYNFGYEIKKKELKLFIDSVVLKIPLNKSEMLEVSTVEVDSQFKFQNEDYCYQVDDQCRVVKHNHCEYCPKSYLNVIETNCKTDYSKICVDHGCGKKNQPACIRGWMATNYQLNYCLPDSPIAFCRPGLRVICEAERLVCK